MARKWFQLVDDGGNALTSADAVSVDIEDVVGLRDAVFVKVSRALPTNVIAADLKVFAVTQEGKQTLELEEDSSIGSFGGSKKDALIVQVHDRAESDSRYFIQPNVQEQVEKAVFVIVEEDEGVGMGVFFSPNLAVTCDCNLKERHAVGSVVSLALKEAVANVEVVARNSELDFAILKSSSPRSFIPPWNGRPDELRGRYDLVLASYRLGINE